MDNEMSRKRSEYEDEIDLVELFSVLLSKAWLIVLTAVVFAVISGDYTRFFVTPLYRSTTSIYVLNRQNESTLTSSDLSASTYLTLDYAELIKS
ncbi:MAG: hypothetical protein IJI05_05835, partial [Erysipelotrichaceae bacterium]|nr:hypothetical protein [Erysipelotrichaceae bacterium]